MNDKSNNQRNKVCVLASTHSVFDDRIFHKQCKSLANAGYEVILVAQHEKEGIVDGIHIVPLKKHKNRIARILLSGWQVLKKALPQKADIYHFHDPELIFVGIILRLLGKKTIYDVHEDYPKQILYKKWLGNKYIRKLAAIITAGIERIGTSFFSAIVAATPDIEKKFPKAKTITVRNFPILELIDKIEPANCGKDKPIIIYAGGLGAIRGIRELIQAMELVREKANLWLIGRWVDEDFEKECRCLEGWKYTKYLGFVPLSEVYKYMKMADIGISILCPIKNYLTSLPVKAYEYMYCGLPAVMSNFPYWENFFGESAVFVDPYKPKEIADKILMLLENPDISKRLGDNGKKMVVEKYNWEKESERLIDLYERLLNENKISD